MSLAQRAERATVPFSLSKSAAKATGCEHYFVRQYLEPHAPRLRATFGAEVGQEFHRYRSAYVRRLVETQETTDLPWIRNWLRSQAFFPESLELITGDLEVFSIRPATVVGTELLLSVDETFKPLEYRDNAIPGETTRSLVSYSHGILDLLCIEDKTAKASDAKTGWSAANVDTYEAVHYAALIFAHFPYVEMVEFEWDFIRATKDAPVLFHRALLPLLQEEVRLRSRRRDRIQERHLDGIEAEVDPTAGLCAYCPFQCPLRDQITRPLYDHEPLQDLATAQALTERLYLAQEYLSCGRALLKQYLDTAQGGRVQCRNGISAEMRPELSTSYPLDKVLVELGVIDAENVPRATPKWDIPLESLQVRTTGLKQKAKAKKRMGLMSRLEAIGDTKSRFELAIHRNWSVQAEPAEEPAEEPFAAAQD